MPELPEVETVRRSLEPHIVGKKVSGVVVRERRLRKRIVEDFEDRLYGRTFKRLGRRGKYLMFHLDDGQTVLSHLGMSGAFYLRPRLTPLAKHDHVSIEIATSDVLVLNDPRRFGTMRIGHGEDFEELNNVGPDPMSTRRTADQWRTIVRSKKTPIKTLLMDQRLIAGIGNIYANEMLFLAGIRPRRRASGLTKRELGALEDAMHAVLHRAVELGGSSISDFRDVSGKPGYFQIHHAVYDRAGAPCPRCSSAIRRLVVTGRSTFYCPSCQN